MLEGSDIKEINGVPFSWWKGPGDSDLYLINTLEEWKTIHPLLMEKPLIALDTETDGLYPHLGNRIVGISFGWEKTHFYVPVRHEDSVLGGSTPPQLDLEEIREDLQAVFNRTDLELILHNAKFDRTMFKKDGFSFCGPFHDSAILWHFYDENAPKKLKSIASGWTTEFGDRVEGLVDADANKNEKIIDVWRGQEAAARRAVFRTEVKRVVGELSQEIEHQDKTKTELKAWALKHHSALFTHPYKAAEKDDVHYGCIPIQIMTPYAALDTYLTWVVYHYVKDNMTMSSALQQLYENEIKFSLVLEEAEWEGAKVDRKYLEELEKTLCKEIEEQESVLKRELGDINLGSTVQLSQALLDRGVPLTEKTKGKKFSTSEEALKKFEARFPIIKAILKLRKDTKILSTYVRGILSKLDENDRVHSSFNQNVSTGRMSSSDPNLQNLPGADDRIRRAFIPPSDDFVYLLVDYSQVEVRLTTHYSQDPLLLDAYAKDQDIHTRTTCEVFNFNYNEVDPVISKEDSSHPEYKKWKNYRTISKRVTFGVIYGVGGEGLSTQIPRPAEYADCTEAEWVKICEKFISDFFNRYVGVQKFIKSTEKSIKRSGVAINHFGRVRRLPHSQTTNRKEYWKVARACRQGVNFKIQSTAADVFKTAVVRCAELMKGTQSKIINFVHDEIQFYIHKDELYLLNQIRDAMEDFDFSVPLVADVSYTKTNWAEKRKLG